jgi:LPXTG-site transpeptidase (sortase) family protein
MFFAIVVTITILAACLFVLRRSRSDPAAAADLALKTIKQSNNQTVAPTVGYTEPNPSMSRWSLTLAAVLFTAAVIALALAVRPAGDNRPQLALGPAATATAVAQQSSSPSSGSTEATPATAAPGDPPEGVDIARLLVPSLGIDAPIITMGVDTDGTMQSPANPTDVAWYSFSARPGERSNVVMAGHLDYVNYGPAVFYRIKEARPGEEVQLVLVDGTTASYRVIDVTSYDEATAPVLDIVGPTDAELVTLITCGGSFDPLAREYDKRVVLRAERVLDAAVNN